MRYIGIQHRVKLTADFEPRPTMVAILEDGKATQYALDTEQAELDFVLGKFPVEFKKVEPTDSFDGILPHHIKWRKPKDGETPEQFHAARTRSAEKSFEVAEKIPFRYDGLQKGDVVAMTLGGSGDCLAYALARKGDEVGASVIRIPSFVLKKWRAKPAEDGPVHFGDEPKKQGKKSVPKSKVDTSGDYILLTELAAEKPGIFYPLAARDRDLIVAREAWRALNESMKARMACGLRLRQSFIGRIFTNPEGLFPEGGIEKRYDEVKASDVIMNALETEETKREKDLVNALEKLDIYKKVFKPIQGVGPKIAARIIAAIVDIRRFESDAQLKAFCGVHVLSDGRFPRQRRNEVANWHPDARQALYLLAEQFNRRPDSDWGKHLLAVKESLRQIHPAPTPIKVTDNDNGGTKTVIRWNKGHIHKTALWRTATHFVEWLHGEWMFIETGERPKKARLAA